MFTCASLYHFCMISIFCLKLKLLVYSSINLIIKTKFCITFTFYKVLQFWQIFSSNVCNTSIRQVSVWVNKDHNAYYRVHGPEHLSAAEKTALHKFINYASSTPPATLILRNIFPNILSTSNKILYHKLTLYVKYNTWFIHWRHLHHF